MAGGELLRTTSLDAEGEALRVKLAQERAPESVLRVQLIALNFNTQMTPSFTCWGTFPPWPPRPPPPPAPP
eukprot:2979812-Pleurochrysis_carterae.AAC.1